jgi:hypothetical protein
MGCCSVVATTAESMAIKPIARTDLEKEVSFIAVEVFKMI